MSGLREPLTRLLGYMEEYALAADESEIPDPFLSDARVRECYRELSAFVDAHPATTEPAIPAGMREVAESNPARAPTGEERSPLREWTDETGKVWMVWNDVQIGGPGNCRTCKAPVLWIKRPDPKAPLVLVPHPLDQDGKSHFKTCPQADAWRREGS
jgi:hypothetical protein